MIRIRFTKEQAKVLQTAAKIHARVPNKFSSLNAVLFTFDDQGMSIQSTNTTIYYRHWFSWLYLDSDSDNKGPKEMLVAKNDLKGIKGPVTLEFTDQSYRIDEITEHPFYSDIHPEHPERQFENITGVSSYYFDVIESVASAAAQKDGRKPILEGVYHHDRNVVATDSHRIHVYEGPEWLEPFLIPAGAVKTLATIFRGQPGAVSVDDHFVHYHVLRIREVIDVAIRKMAAVYPDTQHVFQKPATMIAKIVDTKAVFSALDKIIRLLKDVKNMPVRIETKINTIKLSAQAESKQFESEIGVEVIEPDRRITLNARYLKDALKHVGPCEVYSGDEEGDPIVLEGTGRKALILPVVIR